ncbi:MAG: FtsX-like permease family protein [Myxococcota bacterium]
MRALLRRLTLPAFVALRLVRSRRSKRLSTVTLVSMVGIAFGVMALTIVLGVTSGFQEAFQRRILGLYPHIVVLKRSGDFRDYEAELENLAQVQGVAAATPATFDDMMMAAGVHRAGAVIKGVDVGTVDDVVNVGELLLEGSVESLKEAAVVTRNGETITVSDAIAATWLTLVAGSETAGDRLIRDDRTPPEAGFARVTVLDLRQADTPVKVTLKPSEGTALAVGPGRSEVRFSTTGTDSLAPSQEVKAGPWLIDLTGEQLEVRADTILTVVLRDGAEGMETRLMVEPARMPRREGVAMVRLFNQGSASALSLGGIVGSDAPSQVARGEFTQYHEVQARLPGLIIGKALAKRLDASLGTEVTIVTPLRGVDNKMLGPSGMAPSSARHVVTGIFESGFHEYDVRLGLVNLKAAQRFLNRGKVVRWLEVKATDLMRVDDVKRRLTTALDPYDIETLTRQVNGFEAKVQRYAAGGVRDAGHQPSSSFIGGVRNGLQMVNLLKYQETDFGYRPRYRLIDWEEMNANLFSALKLQKVVLTIFFLIIIIVGSFVVVGSQIMIIHEKGPDIAILKAMGATSHMIRAVFTLQGLFVAGLGTLFGVIAGFGACKALQAIDYRLDASVYLIDRLPVELELSNAILVGVATALCTLAATQYSAARAASKSPVDGLRAVD